MKSIIKKTLVVCMCALLLAGAFPIAAFADEVKSEYNISYTIGDDDIIYANEVNELKINIVNRKQSLKNARIYLEFETPGMKLEKGGEKRYVGTFVVDNSTSASFPIICENSVSTGSHKIIVHVEGEVSNYDPTSGMYVGEETKDFKEAFYVQVQRGSSGKVSDVASPILMVSNYSTGGNVTAGRTFTLSVTLLNTSKVDLNNIKVTFDTKGAFVPVGASNSFYVESIPAGEKVSKSISLSSQRDLAQGSHGIVVNMNYESNKQNFSSADEISAYVVQESRLVIDDILDPGHLTMNDNCYCSVNYRNMGNSQISNLTLRVEGDFSIEGNPVYYVGNLQSGKSDSYNFSFHPNQAGECAGKVNFTYEDAGGSEHSIDKEFVFNIGEGFNPEDFPDDMPIQPQQKTLPSWAWIAILAVAVIVIIVIVKAVKKHKANKQGALDLDED